MVNRALPPLLAVFLLRLLSGPVLAQDAPPPKPVPPQAVEVRTLFLANCAQCHGEKGDGEGVTQLDRKARSFLDGGFSYGNTREAILRSITHGIPGTPMPSFEKALDETQRTALAQYVIAFGPDQIVVDPSESEMVVKDRPLVVRGKLPPLVEGAPEIPRGLAIGTPEGLTFEYRADDVQLLAVRAGRFVNRTDWGDRGGQALEMLGRPIWTSTSDLHPDQFSLTRVVDGWPEPYASQHARLLATSTSEHHAEIEYLLEARDGESEMSVVVRQSCGAYRDALGSGFLLRSVVRSNKSGAAFTLCSIPEGMNCLMAENFTVHAGSKGKPWAVVVRWRGDSPKSTRLRQLGQSAHIAIAPRSEATIEALVFLELAAPLVLSEESTMDRLLREYGQ